MYYVPIISSFMTSTGMPSIYNVELSRQAEVNIRNVMHAAGLY